MQPSGGGPDHKAFWVKKLPPKKCGATAMPWCPQICSLLAVPSVFFSALQFPVMWMRLVAIYQAALHIRCVESNHVSGILRKHIAIHSHFNKSLDHISVYSSQFVFSIMQSTLTRLFNQKMHLLLQKTAPVVPVQLPCTQRSINSTTNKNNNILLLTGILWQMFSYLQNISFKLLITLMFILGVIRALTELARYNIFPIYNIYFLTALQFMHDLIYISWLYFVKKEKKLNG